MPKSDIQWKEVPGFPGYFVSEHGAVRSGERLLKPERTHGSGRKRYGLSKGGCTQRYHAAHLVALAFIGPKPFEGAEACHRDGFFHNNHYSNIRWGSHESNVVDAVKQRVLRDDSLGRHVPHTRRLAVAAAAFLANHSGA